MIDETTIEYVPVAAAAARMHLSAHAVRQRVYRGSLPARREGTRLLVGVSPNGHTLASHETARETARDDTRDAEIHFLRERLAARDEEIREMRAGYERQIAELHVLLQTAQRQLPATIEAGASPVRPPERATPSQAHRAPNGVPEGVREGSAPSARIRPAWWRRFLFGEV